MKIMLTGGGTLGPVTPLLAVADAWRDIDTSVEFVWVGTPNGPERALVEAAGIRFLSLPVLRFPRYVSVEWATLPFRIPYVLWKSHNILKNEAPDLIASAGGFTGTPLIGLGKFAGVPSWLHQQDAQPLLSTRLSAPFARCITVAWESSLLHFSRRKTTHVGNPVRKHLFEGNRNRAMSRFHLDPDKETVLIFGGGTGARWMNHTMEPIAKMLSEQANVIHLTGDGKMTETLQNMPEHYFAAERLNEEMADAYAAADIVVARAGMGTISEVCALSKPAVLIPIPSSSHQRANAKKMADAQAALVLDQHQTSPQQLFSAIERLLQDIKLRGEIARRMQAVLRTDVADDLAAHARACVDSALFRSFPE